MALYRSHPKKYVGLSQQPPTSRVIQMVPERLLLLIESEIATTKMKGYNGPKLTLSILTNLKIRYVHTNMYIIKIQFIISVHIVDIRFKMASKNMRTLYGISIIVLELRWTLMRTNSIKV